MTFVHDVIYRPQPRWFTSLERAYLRLIDVSVRRASHVVTSSEAERSMIEDALPAVRGRTAAVGRSAPGSARRHADATGRDGPGGRVRPRGRPAQRPRKNFHLAA